MSDTPTQIERPLKIGTTNPTTIKKGNLFFNAATGVLYVAKADNVLTVVQDAVGLTNTDELPEGSTNLYASLANVVTRLTSVGANNKFINSAGTAYTLTNTNAAAVFGTTSPVITIDAPGTYLLIARCRVEHVGATYAANRVITLQIRRTNNTAADVAASYMIINTGIRTTITETAGNLSTFAQYTTLNSDDSLTIFAGIDTAASAGSSQVVSVQLMAIRIY